MATETNVELEHPDLDQTITVPESKVKIHALSGWTPKKKTKAPKKGDVDDGEN